MAEETDDQWLYGSNPPAPDVAMTEPTVNADSEIEALKSGKSMNTSLDGDGALEIHEEDEPDKELSKDGQEEGEVMLEDIDDESDDDVNVVIGEIAPPTSLYSGFKLGKGGAFSTPQATEKKSQGNFAVNEFDGVGTINGVPAHEFNLDSLEEKPWRKPGADITDYFNYGFNEDTWRAYCERQKRMRVNESGTSISHLPMKPFQTSVERHVPKVAPQAAARRYTPSVQPTKTTIDVIGSSAPSRRAIGYGGDTAADPPPSTAYPLPPPALTSYSAPPPAVYSAYQQPPPTVAAPPPAAPAFYDPYTTAPPPAQASPWNNPPPAQAWPMGTPTSLPPPSLAPSESAYSPARPTHDWSPERDRRPPDTWSPDRDHDRDRSGSSRHHRRRSRSRSRERSRRHRSRSRSPSHRHSSRRKSKKKDRDSD